MERELVLISAHPQLRVDAARVIVMGGEACVVH